ncbi:MAG TPA: GNAT family N-acetyltransferase [Luteimonas sp.]|nr:GNAT family N-acetyltransferase [Luteimonas sp.]HRP73323.1 GNAT family N-acetyltransferase [Luteimonas sp.]
MATAESIRIRAAGIDDAIAISALTTASTRRWITRACTKTGARLLLSSMRPGPTQERLLQGYRYLVAEQDNRIVGVAAMRLPDHLYHLFVDDTVHRLGVARRLWQALLEAEPRDRVTVNAARNAIEAYLHLGFTRDGPERISDGIPSTPMVWQR